MRIAIFIIAAAFIACNQPTKTYKELAHDAIMDYFKENLHDFKSYEEVSFETDTSRVDYILTKKGEDEAVKILMLMNKNANVDTMRKYGAIYDEINKRIVVDTTNYFWVAKVKFRSKNAFGATILNQMSYGLDKNFTVIKKIEDDNTFKQESDIDQLMNADRPLPDTTSR